MYINVPIFNTYLLVSLIVERFHRYRDHEEFSTRQAILLLSFTLFSIELLYLKLEN